MKKLAAVGFTIILTGCATHIPTARESGNLSLSYASNAVGTALPETIALVSPEFSSGERAGGSNVNYQVSFLGLQAVDKSNFVAANEFNQRYQQQLSQAVQSATEDMFQKRGFKTKGPFQAYDDISFTDKKGLYLISNPKISIYFDQNVTSNNCRNNGMMCKQEGNFRIRGEIIYRLQEPLTGQSMLTRRYDLGSFGITKNYVKEYQVRTMSEGLSGALLDKMLAPEKLIDTTDRALSEAVTELFSRVIPKIDQALSREEILTFKQDIAQLKGMKQY